MMASQGTRQIPAFWLPRFFTTIFFIFVTCSYATAEQPPDKVKWIASHLLTGSKNIDYSKALDRFVKFSDPRVLPTLMRLLDSDNTIAKAETAGVMWHYNTKEVRKKLVELTSDLQAPVRIEASKSLCLMKYRAYLDNILEELKSKQQDVRNRALKALALVGGPEAQEAATKLVSSGTPLDRVWARYALYGMDVDKTKQVKVLGKILSGFPKAAWLLKKRDPTLKDISRSAKIASKGKNLRVAAGMALSKIGQDDALWQLMVGTADQSTRRDDFGALALISSFGDQAVSACVRGLSDDRVLVRLGAARTAARLRLHSEASKDALANALGPSVEDESRLVRLAALKAITVHGMSSQTQHLLKAARSSGPDTRRWAILALGAMKNDEHLDDLVRMLNSEKSVKVRKAIYKAISMVESPAAVGPMMSMLKKLFKQRSSSSKAAEELPLCIEALASSGDPAAKIALRLLDKLQGEKRDLMVEVLARTGSSLAVDFFMDILRDAPPRPDSPAVRFFDSLDSSFVPSLEKLITQETAMWIRVILARALFRLGETQYGRGILWALKNNDVYYRRLGAAEASGLEVPGSVHPLISLLTDEPETAWYAARALMSIGTPKAIDAILQACLSEDGSLRQRRKVPVTLYWEAQRSTGHPYAKEVDNERVWVLFAEDRIGGKLDLFLTWSGDGSTWTEPVFTGLSSFYDPSGQVPPPTFSIKVRGRDITLALTRTFAKSFSSTKPKFTTIQRVFKRKLKEFFSDKDSDGLKDLEESSRFTNPSRADTDRDGIDDGQDKNPLAKPISAGKDIDILRLLAFSQSLLVKRDLSPHSKLLVVEVVAGQRRPPELPTWPWLVLHLKPEQIAKFWKDTGGGFPRVRFGRTEIKKDGTRAIQFMDIFNSMDDVDQIEVTFVKRVGQWLVRSYRHSD